MKAKLRRIVVGDVLYLWRITHHHSPESQHNACFETLTIYCEGHKSSPLILLFIVKDSIEDTSGSHWQVGFPQAGVAWKLGDDAKTVNLNRPGVIAAIIRFANRYWNPLDSNQPTEIKDGFKWLEEIEFPASRQ